jgi:hypothetical protein
MRRAARGRAHAFALRGRGRPTDTENNDLLRLFGHGEAHTTEARQWLSQQLGSEKAGMTMEELEEFDDVMKKLLVRLGPERVLQMYSPEQRLAGLSSEQVLLTLPIEVLCGLSAAYLDTLPEATRAAIRARIGTHPAG